jgi:FkbM family methyltransferase
MCTAGGRATLATVFSRLSLLRGLPAFHMKFSKKITYIFWVFANIFGYLFGRRLFSPLYHAIINISLHGLGYDNIFRSSWTGEEWFIKNVLTQRKPRICLDIGANIGEYTKLLLKHTSAKIYAIEPDPSRTLIASERVTIVKAAIADFNGEAVLYSKTDHDYRASLDKNLMAWQKEEKVKVLTIQALAEQYNLPEIDFIKIDIEGYEKEAIKGLGAVRPALMQFEFHLHHLYRNCTFYEISKLLPEYEFYRLLPRGWLKIDPRKFLNNIFMFCNIIAIKK